MLKASLLSMTATFWAGFVSAMYMREQGCDIEKEPKGYNSGWKKGGV
jgi:hypothetical protein